MQWKLPIPFIDSKRLISGIKAGYHKVRGTTSVTTALQTTINLTLSWDLVEGDVAWFHWRHGAPRSTVARRGGQAEPTGYRSNHLDVYTEHRVLLITWQGHRRMGQFFWGGSLAIFARKIFRQTRKTACSPKLAKCQRTESVYIGDNKGSL